MDMTLTLTINGEIEHHPAETSVLELVKQRVGNPQKGIAVAKNGRIVNRSHWNESLANGDEIEIIIASQGG